MISGAKPLLPAPKLPCRRAFWGESMASCPRFNCQKDYTTRRMTSPTMNVTINNKPIYRFCAVRSNTFTISYFLILNFSQLLDCNQHLTQYQELTAHAENVLKSGWQISLPLYPKEYDFGGEVRDGDQVQPQRYQAQLSKYQAQPPKCKVHRLLFFRFYFLPTFAAP